MTRSCRLPLTLALLLALAAPGARADDDAKKQPPQDAPRELEPPSAEEGEKLPEKVPPEIDTTETKIVGEADPGLGSEERKRMNEAVDLIKAGRVGEAIAITDAVLARFDALMSEESTAYVVVSNAKELAEIKRLLSPKAKVVWVDHAYRQALHIKAFIAVAQRKDDEARAWLRREMERAPFSAEAHSELGYLLNRRGDPTEALASYERAIALARAHPAERRFLPAALRGKGFSLIELDRLDEAKATFEESLKLEPGNPIATQELEYIEKLKRERGR